MMRRLLIAALVLGWAGASLAQAPTPVEAFRVVEPRVGLRVVVPVNGVPVATIEWRRSIEFRTRAESGMVLSPAERQAIREIATEPGCDRGQLRNLSDRVEWNGTYVVSYECVWLQ